MKTVIVLVFVILAMLALTALTVAALALGEVDDEMLPPDWEETDSDRARRLRGD